MALTERDYTKQINALLPRGPVWTRRTGGLIDAILYAAACEFARVRCGASNLDRVGSSDVLTALAAMV